MISNFHFEGKRNRREQITTTTKLFTNCVVGGLKFGLAMFTRDQYTNE